MERVSEILDTYELPGSLRKLVELIGSRREYSSFEETYDYLSFLVDRFTAGRSVSLDEPFSRFPKMSLLSVMNQQSEERTGEVMPVNLSKLFLDFWEGRLVLPDSGSAERMGELIERFRFKGRVIVPVRPIAHVSFGPIDVRFGRRNFPKGPWNFYQEHSEVYGGLSRGQLYKVDRGLYRALAASGDIEKVPRKNRVYGGNPLAFYQANLGKYGGLTRSQLAQADPGLHRAMVSSGDINVIPTVHREYNGNPLDYFRENIERYRGMNRSRLCKFDQGLYLALDSAGQLDEAVPSTRTFYGDPLQYFREHPEYHGLSRWQLGKKNRSLYNALVRDKKIDQAIPGRIRKQRSRGLP